jgi:TolB-like protein/tetratricopeptide (TPR) repeat protein
VQTRATSVRDPGPRRRKYGSIDDLLRELVSVSEQSSTPSAPEAPSLPPGTTIGRFELIRELGRGGLGVVYEARDTSLGRTVAFKLVRGGDRQDARGERLIREAEAAARLSHPNVVTLHDVGTSEHGPYLVLELLRGETLGSRLKRGALPLAEAWRIAADLAAGLAHAHSLGVVHGDVTPGNVFVCADGRVKLLDLGLSRVFGEATSGGGTRGYMAPELRSGSASSERSDVFGLGVVLFEMLTGRLPYVADDDGARPRLRLPAAPALAAAVERMLAPDATDRPRDATVVSAELSKLEATVTGKAAPISWRSPRILLAVGLGVVVSLLGGSMASRRLGGSRPPGAAALHSVAVLPFVDDSADHSQQYLAEGVADHVLSALSRVDGVHTIARKSAFSIPSSRPLAEVGGSLGVKHVLTGRTRQLGNQIEVTAELHDAGGATLWSHSYARDLSDIFSIQDDVVAMTLRTMGVDPTGGGIAPARSLIPRNAEAYARFLQGRRLYFQATPENWRLARDSYEHALALDPGYASAWAGLAILMFVTAEAGVQPKGEDPKALRKAALTAAEKAAGLEPELPDARGVRGYLRALVDGDWSRGLADMEHAMALDPNDADNLRRYSMAVGAFGRLDEAIAASEKSAARDPLNPQSWLMLAQLQLAKGDLEAAERACQRASSIVPDSPLVLLFVASVRLMQNRADEAAAMFARSPELYGLSGQAMAEHSLGHVAKSEEALQALVRKYARTGAYFIAQVYAWRGQADLAFQWLDRAVANEEPAVRVIRYDALLLRLESDARFEAFARKANLPRS